MSHYDDDYFKWQIAMGQFAPTVDQFLFNSYIKTSDNVVDFGCGGAFMLRTLNCKDRIGIEINDAARKYAAEQGIKTFKTSDELHDNWADVIISNNALEHTLSPYHELSKLYQKLKPGGKVVFVIPEERKTAWRPDNVDMHLYTWTCMCAGNLFKTIGFQIEEVRRFPVWAPYPFLVKRLFGVKGFHLISKITRKFGCWNQIRVIATKPQIEEKP